jgi:predicted NAD/FAD-dependent oxidoreductase
MKRRTLLHLGPASAVAATLPLGACQPQGHPPLQGGWVGASHERGHRLRPATSASLSTLWASATPRKASVLIVGGGVAGLAAARAFAQRGVDDVQLLELEDSIGGNARGHRIAGLPCPLGAHYLPLPTPEAREVNEWLHEIGLLRMQAGQSRPDERHLAHSPQERLFYQGEWIEGLLPPAAAGSAAMQQYQAFAALVAGAQRGSARHGTALSPQRGGLAPPGSNTRRVSNASGVSMSNGTNPSSATGSANRAFALPAHRSVWTAESAVLDAQTFATWLQAQGLNEPQLLTYLDYCCRDDYGAGIYTVSAWAGLHYFASRHGFQPGGSGSGEREREAVFTWPEGNAWLTNKLAAPLAGRIHTGRTTIAVREERQGVSVLAFDEAQGRAEAWSAHTVVLAVPLFVARRLLQTPPAALQEAAALIHYAPWLVANLQLEGPLSEQAGAPPAWDNVIHGSAGLGYVNTQHQSLRPDAASAGPQLITAYQALPTTELAALLQADWQPWAERVLQDISVAHPDVRQRLQRIDLMRWGHAMAIPTPGLQRHPALMALRAMKGRVRFAHSDLAGYSVFEEAFTAGSEAGV